jgi:opacity protein-like surface antigen
MKKIISAVLGLLLVASTASAAGLYVGGSLGVTLLSNSTLSDALGDYGTASYDAGFLANGYVGYDFGFIRTEFELGYQFASISKFNLVPGVILGPGGGSVLTVNNPDLNIGIFTGMANVWVDIKNRSRFIPYLGGGVGFAAVSWSNSCYNGCNYYEYDSDTVFAYQVGGGVAFKVTNNLDIDIGYRYFSTENLNLGLYTPGTYPPYSTKLSSNNVLVGARFMFR